MSSPMPSPAPAAPLEPPPAAAAPAAGPQPKARGLVRWGVLVFLVVGFLAFALVGAGPITKWAVQKYGSQGLGTEVKLDSASFNVFKLAVTLKGFRAVDPADPSKNQFEAEEIRATIDPLDSLKGQLVIGEMAVVRPKGRLVRNADGTIGSEPAPAPPTGTAESESAWKKRLEEEAKKRDLVEDVKNLAKKWKERRDRQVAEREAEKKRREEQGVQDWMGRADYIRGPRPLVVVRKVSMEGVELTVEDKGNGAPPQTITDATVELKELSSSPRRHDRPIEMKLDGKLAGAPASEVKLEGSLDLTGEDTLSQVNAHLANLPLASLDPYLKQIPLRFEGTSIGTVDLPLTLKGWEIDWKPAMLLDHIQAVARERGGKIAGFDADKVATEVTNAGKLLLDSIRIHGPIWAPAIEGDIETVKRLVVEGGKAYAAKQATKLYEDQKAKVFEKNPELQKKLEATGVEKAAGDALRGFGLGGSSPQASTPTSSTGASASSGDSASEAAKKAAEGALDIFGKKKK